MLVTPLLTPGSPERDSGHSLAPTPSGDSRIPEHKSTPSFVESGWQRVLRQLLVPLGPASGMIDRILETLHNSTAERIFRPDAHA